MKERPLTMLRRIEVRSLMDILTDAVHTRLLALEAHLLSARRALFKNSTSHSPVLIAYRINRSINPSVLWVRQS